MSDSELRVWDRPELRRGVKSLLSRYRGEKRVTEIIRAVAKGHIGGLERAARLTHGKTSTQACRDRIKVDIRDCKEEAGCAGYRVRGG